MTRTWIREARRRAGLSVPALATQTGLPLDRLQDIEAGLSLARDEELRVLRWHLRHWIITERGLERVIRMDFGEALRKLRIGHKVARSGWNGRGMCVFLQKGYPEGVPANANTAEAAGIPAGTIIRVLPYLMMRTVDGGLVPWLASQTDILAEDWEVTN